MADSFWLSDAQMARIVPFVPLSLGIARVDDRCVLSGIIQVIRTGMHWSRLGVFNRIFAGLAGQAGEPDRLMIDATHLKAHRTTESLFEKGRSAPGPTCEAGWGGKRRVYPAFSAARRAA